MIEHNYVTKLLRLEAEGKMAQTPGVWHTDVEHDDWCGIHCGQRYDCNPDIYVYRDGDRAARRKL